MVYIFIEKMGIFCDYKLMDMKDKLFISDLDGTLLDNDARLSGYALDNLNRLIESGLNFTIATARSIISVREILTGLKLKLPIIEINGALISDFSTGKHHTINSIEIDTIERLYQRISGLGCEPFISSYDGSRDNLYYSKVANEGMRWFLGDDTEDHATRVRYVGNICDAFCEQVVCVTIIDKEEVMCEVHDIINAEFEGLFQSHFFQNPYCRDWHWVTVHDKRSCKSVAVGELAAQLGYDLNDVVVFGDGINDVEMMKLNTEGVLSICTGNAVDEVKNYADKVIADNTDDGVVNFLLSEV